MTMVEWKKLGEVCDFQNGFAFKSGLFKPEGIPVIRITNISSNNIDMKDCKFFAYDDYKMINLNPFVVEYGDILLAMSGATTGKIGVYKGYEKAYLNQRVGKFVPHETQLNKRYLYHFLSGKTIKLNIMAGGGAQPNLSSIKLMEELILPVPSIPQQAKISCFLDTFTSSIENLKEQIALRRKQYEYYRDQLLDLEGKEGVEMKTLGEIGEFVRGNGIQKSDFIEDGYSCIHYGQIHAKYGFSATETISKIDKSLYDRCKKAKKGDVVLATTSEDAEGVAKPFVWLGDEDAAISGDAFVYHHNQVGKFLGYQFLIHRFMQFKVKYATGAKVVRISGDNMAKFEVALPTLQEQQRIVDILDTFEASIQNLEAQLALREKQYEYYRNKLLTFE